ncbi:ATP-binding protein [candidate division KSB1 bacterium]|nr:ATP-binding protein [candidate division KSB1 bacterium]
MTLISKGKSPFNPGQPVPVELFVGRQKQIDHIMVRGAGQVEAGKPVAVYIQGEYGIGKSSIAGFVQALAEERNHLHAIYAPLGGAENLDDVGAAILEATLRSGAFNPTRKEKIRQWLAKYVGEQSLFGFTVRADALKKDAPTVASGLLPFLQEVMNRLQETGVKGVFLVLDEINGITANPKFAHFLKALVDTNALSRTPLTLMLMLCGVEERRREMIHHHQPVERIFDIVEIEPMSREEMEDFFKKAFDSVHIQVEAEAMNAMTANSAGFPKIMHLIGDAAFWLDQDGIISAEDAGSAIIMAADEVGKKFVAQQVYKALRSADYHSILAKIAQMTPTTMSFRRAEVIAGLTETEKKKFDNFLQKMKTLKVIRSGETQGEYVFNMRMVWLYILLQSLLRKPAKK